jgi:hypothetical protein
VLDRVRLLRAGDQEDDAPRGVEGRRRQRHACDEGLQLRLRRDREAVALL